MPTIEDDPRYRAHQAATGGGHQAAQIAKGMAGFAALAKQIKNMRSMQPQAKERTDYDIKGGSGEPNWGAQGVTPMGQEGELEAGGSEETDGGGDGAE